jgi:signal transduction histidine kinase
MSSARSRRLLRSIGVRLAVWYAACLGLSLLLILAFAYPWVARTLREADRASVKEELAELRSLHRAGGLARVAQFLAGQQREGSLEPLVIHVVDPTGQTLFLHGPATLPPLDPDRLARAEAEHRGKWRVVEVADGRAVELRTVALEGGGLIRVGRSTEARAAVLGHLGGLVVAVLAPALLLSIAGGWVLAWSALRPIRHLVETVRRIEVGAIEARVATRGSGDELDDLGALFNRMLDRIQALIQAMRSSLDDAAHELRTPLTRLRGAAEMVLGSGAGLDTCREALADCVEEADRLLALLDTMMDIAEAETGTLRLAREPLDVRALVADTLDLYRDVAEAHGIALSSDVCDLGVLADRGRLRQALANLVDNALKYTPPGGRVEVSARTGPAGVEIAVRDTGIGITPEELPQIWTRLFRGDRARRRPGLGLGLSLVRAIVQAHGGQVHVASAPAAGSTFTIVLPAAPAGAGRPAGQRPDIARV